MPPDESNEFFDHLNRPANRRPSSHNQQRPEDFSQISDPFAEEGESGEHAEAPPSGPPSLQGRGRERIRQSQHMKKPKGPGLSPGIPQQRERKPTQTVQQSGVVLTPGGVKRVDDDPPEPPRSKATRRVVSSPVDIPAGDEDDFYEQSRQRIEEGDVGWEEYAAQDFPAMEAEEFGVKVDTTQSGRVVPVGVRADLTDEALKNRSIKGGQGKRRPRPAKTKKQDNAPEAPRSFMQKIGDSLRLSKPVFEEEAPEPRAEKSTKGGFAPSGSLPSRKQVGRKKTPLGIVWSITVEVGKILLLVLLLRAYVVQVSRVEGPSMEPTLEQGDRLIVERVTPILANNSEKAWIAWLPDFVMPEFERGDLVVVRSPEDPGAELVKRLIALPGDTIKFEDGGLYLKPTGADEFEVVNEDYINNESLQRDDGTYRSYRDSSDLGGIVEGEEIVVPQDRIFVLGDNRSQSNDSRRWMEIQVKRTEPSGISELWLHQNSIEGRVIFRIYPFDRTWPPVK